MHNHLRVYTVIASRHKCMLSCSFLLIGLPKLFYITCTCTANTADNVKRCTRTKFGERCFSHAGPAAWNSLPASIKLTTDTNRFTKTSKSSPVSHSILTFVSAPGQFVSRALYKFPFVFVFVFVFAFVLEQIKNIKNKNHSSMSV